MKIIVGLGNPGKKFMYTRHNAGFLFIDYYSSLYNIKVDKIKFKGLYGQGVINAQRVILLKPQTFMNLSGESIQAVLAFFKCTLKDLIVIYDDVALELGKIRVRTKGSDGGHKGIRSIIYLNKSDEFDRVKLGIGSPDHPGYDLTDYVIGDFEKQEEKIIIESIKRASKAVDLIIDNKTAEAMNDYNA